MLRKFAERSDFLKKSAFVLAMMLMLSLFTFVGCGENDKSGDMTDNNTITENNDGIVDETEKGVDDLGNAAEDGVDDLADDAEDLVDGGDNNAKKNTDNTKTETKNMNQ